jgi:hypothetical protein
MSSDKLADLCRRPIPGESQHGTGTRSYPSEIISPNQRQKLAIRNGDGCSIGGLDQRGAKSDVFNVPSLSSNGHESPTATGRVADRRNTTEREKNCWTPKSPVFRSSLLKIKDYA